MCRFITIRASKLDVSSGNTHIGAKFSISHPIWLWNLTDDIENNRASIPCLCKLCASFCNLLWIQTGVMVRKWPNRGKICLLLWLDLWPLTLTFCIDIILSMRMTWASHDDTTTETLWKGYDRQSDRRRETDSTVNRAALLQLKWEDIVVLVQILLNKERDLRIGTRPSLYIFDGSASQFQRQVQE